MSVEEIFQTMRDLVSEQFALEPSEVTMDTSFEEDLGADSVDLPAADTLALGDFFYLLHSDSPPLHMARLCAPGFIVSCFFR